MLAPALAYRPTVRRVARARRYVMCAPTHFGVRYAINHWMDPSAGADAAIATAQWNELRRTYLDLGHSVDLLAPHPDLPDMVFAANGALVIDGRVFGAAFAYPQRRPEAGIHRAHLAARGLADVMVSAHTNEGEGDFLVVGPLILAGTGFRTDRAAHGDAENFFHRPVVSLHLVDPRFYHLDTALAVLDDQTIAYYPPAFSADSRSVLRELFPQALIVTQADALVLGLNAVSDGYNVVLPARAVAFADLLREHGFNPIPIDLSELFKAGGSVKCTTMELHS